MLAPISIYTDELWIERLHNHAKADPMFYERVIHRIYCSVLKPGDTVVDGGANVGFHSFLMADHVGRGGRVLAFEPIPHLVRLIRHTAQIYRLPNITLIEKALGRQSGKSSFCWVKNSTGYSGLKRMDNNFATMKHKALTEDIEVEVTTLDAMPEIGDSLRFIKLDLEGGEFDMLHGAEKTIQRCNPVIILEYGAFAREIYQFTHDEFIAFFARLGYAVYDLFGRPDDYLLANPDCCAACYLIAVPAGSQNEAMILQNLPDFLGQG